MSVLVKISYTVAKIYKSHLHQAGLIEIINEISHWIQCICDHMSESINIIDTAIYINEPVGLSSVIFIKICISVSGCKTVRNDICGKILELVIKINMSSYSGNGKAVCSLPECGALVIAIVSPLCNPLVIGKRTYLVTEHAPVGINHRIISCRFHDLAECLADHCIGKRIECLLSVIFKIENNRHTDSIRSYGIYYPLGFDRTVSNRRCV